MLYQDESRCIGSPFFFKKDFIVIPTAGTVSNILFLDFLFFLTSLPIYIKYFNQLSTDLSGYLKISFEAANIIKAV